MPTTITPIAFPGLPGSAASRRSAAAASPSSAGSAAGQVTPAAAVQAPRRYGVATAAARAIESRVDQRKSTPLYDHRGRLSAQAAERARAPEAPPPRPRPFDQSLLATEGGTSVEILASESDYDNEIVYSTDGFKTYTSLGVDNRGGAPVALEADAGTRLEFGIVNGEGQLLRAGAPTLNADGEVHARATTGADDSVTLGFEDLSGGGDRDFDDAVIRVTHARLSDPAADGATAPQRSRSGLADGSNPGQGDGRVRSPNDGSANPAAGEGMRRAARPAVPPARELQTAAAQEAAERKRQLLDSVYTPAAKAAPARAARSSRSTAVLQAEAAARPRPEAPVSRSAERKTVRSA